MSRDHGGNLDSAIQMWGGRRDTWLDLSTGINPAPYPLPNIPDNAWAALPDQAAIDALIQAARKFWNVPDSLDVLPTNGASAPIAALPLVFKGKTVDIPAPTYNEHAAAFRAQGWETAQGADACVLVNPNNPDGRIWTDRDLSQPQTIIDESFTDCCPEVSLLPQLTSDQQIVLKSFGKFWGLAGLRLGFVIAAPQVIAKLKDILGPWSVSGPALHVGTAALRDPDWAKTTRARLMQDSATLDTLVSGFGASCLGGTPLFRLYETTNAQVFQTHLARHHIWTRIFPYSQTWVRIGLPPAHGWDRLKQALSK